MSDPAEGLLDTSVVIDYDVVDHERLPDRSAIASVTLAELAVGLHVTDDAQERAGRQDRLQWATDTWSSLPFDSDAARAYGRIYAAVRSAGREPRRRMADLLIAATAASNDLALYTRNPRDFAHLDAIVTVVGI